MDAPVSGGATRAGQGDLRIVVAGAAQAVDRVRPLTPADIVLSGDGVPCLVDFALATSVAEMRPEFTPHS